MQNPFLWFNFNFRSRSCQIQYGHPTPSGLLWNGDIWFMPCEQYTSRYTKDISSRETNL